MNSIVKVRPEIVEREQQSATAAAEEAPADLDAELTRLDGELNKLDELTEKDRNFPAELAAIEARCEALTNQELDSVEAIQSRSAEMGKISAMRELAVARQKKLKAAITAQMELAIKLGMQIAGLLEAKWWNNYVTRAEEIEREFSRLFYRFGLEQSLQDSYRPIVLLKWTPVPNFNVSRFSSPDTKIAKCRQLRESAEKLREFESLSFAQIADRVEEPIAGAESD
jgi:hypothetical protein